MLRGSLEEFFRQRESTPAELQHQRDNQLMRNTLWQRAYYLEQIHCLNRPIVQTVYLVIIYPSADLFNPPASKGNNKRLNGGMNGVRN